MADSNCANEVWDWENMLTSSLLEQDIAWHGDFCEPETTTTTTVPPGSSFPSSDFTGGFPSPELFLESRVDTDSYSNPIATNTANAVNISDASLESSIYNHDTPVSSHHLPPESSTINPSTAVLPRKKKRDPRLECPNFLAGRIPCSCPEEDELEEEVEIEARVKKKPKVAARCQVPSCGEDISHLKGYHQRHRVCLGCANSPRVILKDHPHRYCQQCGKFHRLSDFDEGKRSCRRKLERHNIRRRRRPMEEDAQDCEVPLHRIDDDLNNMQSSPEEAAVQARNADVSTKQSSDTRTARIQHRKEGAMTQGERKARTSIKRSPVANTIQRKEGTRQDIMDPDTIDLHASDDSSASIGLLFEQENCGLDKSSRDEQSLLMMLMGSVNEGTETSTSIENHLLSAKSDFQRTSNLPMNQLNFTDYVSPCPTGRISFKLYDWNPADFPRRLRQQICEWLASMPVELESYVRSGCIILTFFVAMPQMIWDKVSADWIGQVQMCILQSGTELWGTGQLIAQMNEKRVHFRQGKVTNANQENMLAPYLVDLYPVSLVAGCRTHIYVCGFNFSGARFLVSFGERYVECIDWESVDHHHFTHRTVWKNMDKLEVQKVTVFIPDSQKFGSAYMEVDNAHGVSNFMPLLVADKDVCAEINAIGFSQLANKHHDRAKVSRAHRYGVDILTDMGWALKYMNKHRLDHKPEIQGAWMNRLQRLLSFSLEHHCNELAKRLVQMSCGLIGPEGQSMWSILKTTKEFESSTTFRRLHAKAEQCYLSPKLQTSLEPNSGYRVQTEVFEEHVTGVLRPKNLPSVLNSDYNNISLLAKYWTNVEVPLLEESIPILEDQWRQDCWAPPVGWPRKPKRTTGPSFWGVSNRRFWRVLITAVSIVMICTGMCFMFQHPHEVVEISMSLRRCLWGYNDTGHV